MIELSTRPSVIDRQSAVEISGAADRPLLIGLGEQLTGRRHLVGDRAARLSLATRSLLPVPAGSVLTVAALGCVDHADRTDAPTSADAIGDVFVRLGRGGRIPLMVSVSTVSHPRSFADRITATHGVTTRSDLLHTVRRLSATASLIGDSIAVVVQRDVDVSRSGTLVASETDAVMDPAQIDPLSPNLRARLDELGRNTADAFGERRDIAWAIDRFDQPWILDIGRSDGGP